MAAGRFVATFRSFTPDARAFAARCSVEFEFIEGRELRAMIGNVAEGGSAGTVCAANLPPAVATAGHHAGGCTSQNVVWAPASQASAA